MTAEESEHVVVRIRRILAGAELRGLDGTECRAFRDAAREISILMAELQEAQRQVDRLWDDCIRLTKKNTVALKERDEARRMYCRQTADSMKHYTEPERIAADRGWDCFEQEGMS